MLATQIFLALWVLPLCVGGVVATVATLVGLAIADRHEARLYEAARVARRAMAPGWSVATPAQFRTWLQMRDAYLETLPLAMRPSRSRITPDSDALTAFVESNGLRLPTDTIPTVVAAPPPEALDAYVELPDLPDASGELASFLDSLDSLDSGLTTTRTMPGVAPRAATLPPPPAFPVRPQAIYLRRFAFPVTLTIAYCGGWQNRGVQ